MINTLIYLSLIQTRERSIGEISVYSSKRICHTLDLLVDFI